MQLDYDFIVIGSGFGGSVSALRLVEKGYRVGVFEQGRRWAEADFPKSNWNLARWLWKPGLGLHGFFGMSFFRHVVVLSGHAVGGGSITYANTLLVPPDRVWRQGSWAPLADWTAIMPRHFATARRMLGVTTNRLLGPADLRLKEMAATAGRGASFYPTQVGVFFGNEGDPPGAERADPYFAGEGPARKTCIGCGGCMIGCRFGAKNSLDKNYLYLAEKKGARVCAETRVADVQPLNGSVDGSEGYVVTTVRHGRTERVTCRGVVFAASSLGTQDLLFRLRDKGSLPRISSALGRGVRTNAESLIGVRFPGSKVDLSAGIAIGSGIYIDEHTHIEATRYPNGSNSMALLSTVLTLGRPGLTRPFTWLATLMRMLLTEPVYTLRLLAPVRWASETMIFLCMQTLDTHLTIEFKRRWFWPFGKRLTTVGQKVPTFIPQANAFAIEAAKAMGGVPMTSLSEIVLNVPMTAHCIGGAAMASNRSEGVCDGRNRVFGYRNMYICDGSMVASNLGVNPSLTIAALAEHAMSHIPSASEQRWNATGQELAI